MTFRARTAAKAVRDWIIEKKHIKGKHIYTLQTMTTSTTPPALYLVFDTETTGLPKLTPTRSLYDPRNLEAYSTSRIVSIAWKVLIQSGESFDSLHSAHYYVIPDGFTIPPESTQIHGITEELARCKGVPIGHILQELMNLFNTMNITTLVAHNISFDINVLSSECYRYDQDDLAVIIASKHRFCTMRRGRSLLNLPKPPKLSELYRTLYNEDITNAHDAEYDTLNCSKCFEALMKLIHTNDRDTVDTNDENATKTAGPNLKVSFSDEQLSVIHCPVKSTALVMACAGSGKTTTIVQRIKYLVEECSIDENKVILTTFTNHAAAEMQKRLAKALGHEPEALVGTFDGLSLVILGKFDRGDVGQTHSVSEYSTQLLKFLQVSEGQSFIRNCCSHIFVDEFQDVNDVQFNIVLEMYKLGVHVTCVGDISQNIYTFRDSNIHYIKEFNTYFSDGIIVNMCNNYRSRDSIVRLANEISPEYGSATLQMKAFRSGGQRPVVQFCETQHKQNVIALQSIRDHLDRNTESTVAVLCPHNRYLYPMQEMLTRQGITCTILDQYSATPASYARVCLSTFHKAKGLEWDHVVLIMLHDDVLPISKDDIEEGRRLLYVGVTRARDTLQILFCPLYGRARLSRYLSMLRSSNSLQFIECQPSHFMYSDRKQVANPPSDRRYDVSSLISGMTARKYECIRECLADSDAPKPSCLPIYNGSVSQAVVSHVRTNRLSTFLTDFVALVVHMELFKRGYTHQLRNSRIQQSITEVALDYEEYTVHETYARYFDNPDVMRNIGAIVAGSNVFKKRKAVIKAFLNDSEKLMTSEDMGVVIRILRKVEKHVRSCNSVHAQFEHIHFVKSYGQRSRTISCDLQVLCATYDRFCGGASNVEDLKRLAHVTSRVKRTSNDLDPLLLESISQAVKNDFVDAFLCNQLLVTSAFIDFDVSLPPLTDHTFAYLQGKDRCLMDIVVPEHGHIPFELLLRYLCTKHMLEITDDEPVSNLVFFDPLNGCVHTYNVKAFAKGHQVFQSLCDGLSSRASEK